ncbi:MAG: PAS domain S-box protein [Bacteroidota bacterium]
MKTNIVYNDLLLLMNSISDYAIIRLDTNGDITSWNTGAEKIKTYKANEVIGKNFSIFYSPEDRADGLPQANLQLAALSGSYAGTGWRTRKDGSVFWADMVITALYTDDNKLRGFVKITRDLTPQKEMADELERLHQRAEQSISQKLDATLKERNTILESIGDAFFAVDRHWIVTYWNKKAEKVLQTPKRKILGYPLWSVFADSIGSVSYQRYHEALHTCKAVHFEDYYAPLDIWYDISAYPSGKGLSVYFKDITARKAAENQLKAIAAALAVSEKNYSELFHLSPLPMFVFELDSLRFLDVNDAFVAHYGYSREELLLMDLKGIRPLEDVPAFEAGLVQDQPDNRIERLGVYKHRKKNGEVIQVDIQSNFIHYQGKAAKVTIAADVTERLNYIQAIENQNEKLREISWAQSHLVRAPLAKIMALIPLINDAKEDNGQLLEYLNSSANELDEVIKNITDKAQKGDHPLSPK